MHQAQWVKARAGSLDEALALVRDHVEAHGHGDNWWRWTLALLPGGELRVRDLDDFEKQHLEPEELASHVASVREVPAQWKQVDRWTTCAWAEVWTQLGFEGLQPVRVGALSPGELTTLAEVERTPVAGLPRRFLDTALASLRERYQALDLDAPPGFASMKSRARADRARAFERVYQLLVDEQEDGRHLPFLSDERPDEWPAHLVGRSDAPHVFLLAIDMHL